MSMLMSNSVPTKSRRWSNILHRAGKRRFALLCYFTEKSAYTAGQHKALPALIEAERI